MILLFIKSVAYYKSSSFGEKLIHFETYKFRSLGCTCHAYNM